MDANRSRWASRFIGGTFILGGIAWAIIAALVLGNVLGGVGNYTIGPASSRSVAGGGAGSWFTMGLLSYLLIGVAGIGMSALFYSHIEGTLGSPLTGWRNIAAWIHLIVGGIGAAGASLLMTWGGFQAGAALLPTDSGGGGRKLGYVCAEIPEPPLGPLAARLGEAWFGNLICRVGAAFAWITVPK